MCGLSGFLFGPGAWSGPEIEEILGKQAKSIGHRGPDDTGRWHDHAGGIGLAHRRLAIVDLSPTGHQPMVSASGRYVMVFNGEIYNHLALRQTLSAQEMAPTWRGGSDTETLLAAVDAWGFEATIQSAVGMFAIALWDRERCELTLCRDRFGEKPLYYGWQGSGSKQCFLFGSELKALRAHPTFTGDINRGALALQLRHNCIPAPYSIYEGINKLSPGSFLVVSYEGRAVQVHQYWSTSTVALKGAANPFEGSRAEATTQMERLLSDSIRGQMMADVPLGAFLSGGVDSSTVVALMQAQSDRRVKTFTIGFDRADYNEAEYAKAVARHLGTEHTELYVSAAEAMAVIGNLPAIYDEPFSDSSQIPTYLVAQLAKRDVTVALSGDAGDEVFCGYNRYQITAQLWSRLARLPLPLRRLAARAIKYSSPDAWNSLAAAVRRVAPNAVPFANIGDKLHKGAGVLTSASCAELHLNLASHWRNPASVVLGAQEPSTLMNTRNAGFENIDDMQHMMLVDTLTYLPDDILTKVDRAAMAVSLETRLPYLDHRVVEFAWQLPQDMKLHAGQTKWILREILAKHVPRELFERPKMGFGIPLGEWLRGPLKDWAGALLETGRLKREGFFDAAQVSAKWTQHCAGQRDWQYDLWDVLMFQLWLEQQ